MKNENKIENSNMELFSVGVAIGFALGIFAYKYVEEKLGKKDKDNER